jgi:hypothetical protein
VKKDPRAVLLGYKTLKKHGKEHYRKMADARRTFNGGPHLTNRTCRHCTRALATTNRSGICRECKRNPARRLFS